MHVTKLLHSYFKKACTKIHSKRLERLMILSSSLLNEGKLTVTSLGRHTIGNAQVKNKIKAADRFLSNTKFIEERNDIYQAIAKKVIGPLKEIDILVDWSSCGNRKYHVLRASVAYEGRSVTIYQEVHPEKMLGSYKVHEKFLMMLKKIIPTHCKVTIITDAGFRTDWFILVKACGFDFLGRILSNMQYTQDGIHWKECTSLYSKATPQGQYIGKVSLSKANALTCEMYLYRGQLKKKPKVKKQREQSKVSYRTRQTTANQYRKRYKTPWLLVTSKTVGEKRAKGLIKSYQRRMKIEHDFRDTKDVKWGIGLNLTRTADKERLATLLIVGALGLLMLMLIGLSAEKRNLQYQFQANTIRGTRVLSLIFLGLQVIKHATELISVENIKEAIENLQFNEMRFYKC